MFEKANLYHPDKVADRIAGAITDIAYTRSEGGWLKSNPRIATEVLIGHGEGLVIIETDAPLTVRDVTDTVHRISGIEHCTVRIVPQDPHLADNQKKKLRCGDNGIFKGMPVTKEQRTLTALARTLTENFPSDGKYVLKIRDGAPSAGRLIVCQGQAKRDDIDWCIRHFVQENLPTDLYLFDPAQIVINPLGEWTGGPDVDSGATNRKLGSDMGDAVTGGGLHGKDLSKADVSVNIVCHILAQIYQQPVTACCAIGDDGVEFEVGAHTESYTPWIMHGNKLPKSAPCKFGMDYADIVERARMYILTQHGSFEHFAEWGLI